MDPRELQKVAVQLAAGGTAGECRSAIGRSYYAVYNVGVELLRPIVPISKGPQAHGDVQKCLMNCGDAEVAGVGSDLGDLHSRRIQADYHLDKPAPENRATAQAAVQEATDMIATLDRVFTGPAAGNMAAAIRTYWKDVLRRPL